MLVNITLRVGLFATSMMDSTSFQNLGNHKGLVTVTKRCSELAGITPVIALMACFQNPRKC
jgi:hypothetical protein